MKEEIEYQLNVSVMLQYQKTKTPKSIEDKGD